MYQIRKHVFETNSSSVHTLVLCSEDEMDQLKKNKLMIQDGEVVPPSDDPLVKIAVDRWLYNEDRFKPEDIDVFEAAGHYLCEDESPSEWLIDTESPLPYTIWMDRQRRDFDTFHKTKKFGGQTVYAFGAYGYDG